MGKHKMGLTDEEKDRLTVRQVNEWRYSAFEEEAKKLLWHKKTANSVECPCCRKTMTMRVYEPDLLSWGYPLWEMYKHFGTNGDLCHGNKWFSELAQKAPTDFQKARAHHAAKTRNWIRWCLFGVLESKKKGKYVVTQLGVDFIYERALVPRRVAVLSSNNRVLAFDNEKISFRELVEAAPGDHDYDMMLQEHRQLELFDK